MRGLVRLAAAVLALCVALPASAAKIGVVPIRIELAATARFCSLHVSNQGAEPLALQVRGFGWTQEADGRDQLDPADITINPSIFELAPGEKKLVRCSLPPPAGPGESSFRLLVDELPRGTPAPGTMQTLLQLSLPIFRSPPKAGPVLRWQQATDGSLHLVNVGPAHARLSKLVVTRAGTAPETIDRAFYLLPGSRRTLAPAGSGPVTRIDAVAASGQVEAVARFQP